ncbi:MAG: hypothetical protein JJU20_13770, partial [Opitutales bacterium]|nr:hypothetical protein [Opitutales bacterium]
MNAAITKAKEIVTARQNAINQVLLPVLGSLPMGVRVAYSSALTCLAWKHEAEGILSTESLADAMINFGSPEAMMAAAKPQKKKGPVDPVLARKQAQVNEAMQPVADSLSKDQRKVYSGPISSLAWR